ncbi:estradiol 17-beta-dehydrogenase 2 [Trichonephila clavata]|uniref:Estradiol 17-beta-dehydrogenase 2 n=1 Tax=Trichonephila clavata TaxID=2740835 RepID=A0A8X6HLP6_TRICU|nr:estradiol 17-beta-dehydrogenase 2 [Trichonephila clavata]
MVNRFIAILVCHLLGTYFISTLLHYVLFNHLLYILSPIFAFFLWIFVAAFTLQFTKIKFLAEEVKPENKAVLITGCDSGFGHFLAKRLDSKGFHVFATCFFPDGEGATELQKSCSQRLRVLHLDVTKDDSVKEATEFVKQNLGKCGKKSC